MKTKMKTPYISRWKRLFCKLFGHGRLVFYPEIHTGSYLCGFCHKPLDDYGEEYPNIVNSSQIKEKE
jgi:hypothetical protein